MYTIYGASGTVVGYIVEDSAGRPHALLFFHVARDAPLQVLAPCCHAMFFTRIGRSLHALWTLRCVCGGVCWFECVRACVTAHEQGNIIMKIQRGFFFFKSSLTGAAPASWRAFLCRTRAFVRHLVLQIQAHTPTLSRLRAPTHLLWSPSGASRRLHYRRHRARVHCAQAQVRRARASFASIVWHVTHPNRADTACTRAIPAAAKSKQVTLPFFPLPRVTNHCAVWLNQCSHTVAELQRRGRQLQRACAAACTPSLARSCPRVQYTRRITHCLRRLLLQLTATFPRLERSFPAFLQTRTPTSCTCPPSTISCTAAG
jgi:hypothetical protein